MEFQHKTLLKTEGLTKRFGGLVVMDKLDMSVKEGEIHGLLGPNGAGKSTFFNLVTGVLKPTSGKIIYDDVMDITNAKPHQVARMGIGRTFQLNPLFGDFTVEENIMAAQYLHPHSTIPQVFLNTKKYRDNEKEAAKATKDILEFLNMTSIKDVKAKALPHGYQKLLGVARALAVKPKLLMLDEPLGGMNPEEIHFTLKAIDKMNKEIGISILIVEHNMQVLDICDNVTVIAFGKKIFDGTSDEVRDDAEVNRVYFGGVEYE
ncbi:MAG: ABC transporter ATP-binding protein [Parasporobacterium sp.]|nr:ABC transporter ATP-binding protein [Parasporobacterium sp.]